MERPTGVTILAVVAFIGAGLCALAGLALLGIAIFAGARLLSHLAEYPQLAIVAGVGGAVIGVICLLSAVLYVVIGIGYWKLKNWARILSVVLICLALASSCVSLVVALTHISTGFFLGLFFRRLVLAAVQIWILIYLFKPQVKQAFGSTGL